MGQRRARGLGLVDELQRSNRFTVGVLLSVLVLSLVTSGYLLLVSQPRVTAYIEMGRQARDAHDGMLDQETGLRAWLATGQPEFLAPYRSGRQDAQRAVDELLVQMKGYPELTPGVLRMLLARQRWQTWATQAARTHLTTRQLTDGTLTALLRRGKVLFDAYRVRETASTTQIRDRRTDAVRRQSLALEAALVSYLVLLAAAGTVTVRRRRRLRSTILVPITDLHDTVLTLRSGDLSARTAPTDVPELKEIGDALAGLADELSTAELEARAREWRLANLASRFETVISVGREIAGSLSVRYVSASVTTAAANLLSTSTVLWLRGEDQQFQAVSRSEDAHGVAPPADLLAPPLVARAAAEAQTVTSQGTRAYPLVLAGMEIGRAHV